MRIDLAQTADWLRRQDDYLILTHRRPDGDTVGCAGALCLGLRAIGKRAMVLANPQSVSYTHLDVYKRQGIMCLNLE